MRIFFSLGFVQDPTLAVDDDNDEVILWFVLLQWW
jgi:hypothetical protein